VDVPGDIIHSSGHEEGSIKKETELKNQGPSAGKFNQERMRGKMKRVMQAVQWEDLIMRNNK